MTAIIGADAAKLADLQIDTLQKVRSGHITPEHWEWFNLLTKEERDRLASNGAAPVIAEKPKQETSILRCISEGKSLAIAATDGTQTISDAKDVFPAYRDPDFKNWDANEAGGPTQETQVTVHELVRDAKFAQMFGSLGVDQQKLCLTHGQIIEFCKTHRDWLRTEGYATFFLFQSSKGKFFVADVRFGDRGQLEVRVNQFGHGRVWLAEDRFRVVFPQL